MHRVAERPMSSKHESHLLTIVKLVAYPWITGAKASTAEVTGETAPNRIGQRISA